MKQNKIQTLKGFRDFLPDTMRVRNYVKNIFINSLESFGFEPLETPTLEYASTLLRKCGEDSDKLVYTFNDKGNRKVGLRYDLTVPVSKVLAIYKDKIPLPFKQYQIQLVWRADKPQKGRYREFIQVEADTFGSSSPISDAEYIALIYQILKNLNFNKFIISINSRQVLNNLLENSGIKKGKNSVLQTLDKMNKIGEDGVIKELKQKAVPDTAIKSILDQIKSIKPDQNLKAVLDIIADFGVPKSFFKFDPTLIRGLDYYTGPIFEAFILDNNIGAICGGGRFDNLIKNLGGPDLPATGIAFGFDRIVDCINDLNLMPELSMSNTKVLVTIFDDSTIKNSLQLTNLLRSNNISTFLYPNPDKLSKQFKFTSLKKIPFVVVLGPDEIKNNKITLKEMATGNQQTVSLQKLIDLLK